MDGNPSRYQPYYYSLKARTSISIGVAGDEGRPEIERHRVLALCERCGEEKRVPKTCRRTQPNLGLVNNLSLVADVGRIAAERKRPREETSASGGTFWNTSLNTKQGPPM